MPVLTAREAEKFTGAAVKTVAPVSISTKEKIERKANPKKSDPIFYLQHPDHCVDFAIECEMTVCEEKLQVINGIVKTQIEAVRNALQKNRWILLHTTGGNNGTSAD